MSRETFREKVLASFLTADEDLPLLYILLQVVQFIVNKTVQREIQD